MKIYYYLILTMFFLGLSIHAKSKNNKDFHPDIFNVLDETIEVPISSFLTKDEAKALKLRANISYLFADIKYKNNKIKICEFGGANGAGVRGTPMALRFSQNTMYQSVPYWAFFWHYLMKLNLPVWYVGPNPVKKKAAKLSSRGVRWRLFTELGGRYAKNLENLERDSFFIEQLKKTHKYDPTKLQTYSGIILCRRLYRSKKKYFKRLAVFRNKYPQYLIVGAGTSKFTGNKDLGAALFSGYGLEKYKPKWSLYKTKYTSFLADRIIRDIGSKKYVIKPLNSMQSDGVVLTTKKNLDRLLKFILAPKREHPHTYNYWNKDSKTDMFLVEEYCPSKRIKIRGKWYDPTMRLFFILRCDDNKLYITITGGFWKIPHKSLNTLGSLTEKHVTIHGGPGKTDLPISRSDLRNARAMLAKALPGLYFNMLK